MSEEPTESKEALKQAKKVTEQVTTREQLLFDGFIRNDILIMTNTHQTVPKDIINLCSKFFQIMQHNEVQTKEQLYALAMNCYRQTEFWIAYEILHCLSTMEPLNDRCHNALGLVLDDWGMNEEAEKQYKRAIELKPESDVFRWNYALLLKSDRKYKLAAEQFVKATEIDKLEADYFNQAASCFEKIKDYEQAKVNYLKAIEVNPSNNMHYREYGKLLCRLEEFDQAEEYFKKAIFVDAKDWKPVYHLGID